MTILWNVFVFQQMQDLQEQIRDLMFHFEAEQKVKEAHDDEGITEEDPHEGQLMGVGEQPSSPLKRKGKKKRWPVCLL